MGQTQLELERNGQHQSAVEYWEAACVCPGERVSITPQVRIPPLCPPVAPRGCPSFPQHGTVSPPAAACASSLLSKELGLCPPCELQAGAQPEVAQPGSRSASLQAISVTRSHPSPWPRRPDASLGHGKTFGFSWPAPAGYGAGRKERPSGSCHLVKDNSRPCLPHKPHQTPLPTIPNPKDTSPCSLQGTGCRQACPALEGAACLAGCMSW